MPCMSYDDNWRSAPTDERKIKELKAQADKLARIACKALNALEAMEKEDFLLLKDNEVREWWAKHKEADRQARAAKEAKLAKADAKSRAMAKLTDEEKILLGLKKR